MKTQLNTFLFLGCYLGAIFQLHSQGYIVLNGVTISPGNPTGPGSIIGVAQNPTNGNYTGFFLQPQGSSTFLFNPFLDEGVRTFLVSLNDPVSLQPILANNYTELTYPNNYHFELNTPFYLGFYTGNSFPQNGIYSDPLFGWGEFENVNGVIQMLDSALEYQGGGIYAGTDIIIPVPEPSELALVALCMVLLGHRRCSKQTILSKPFILSWF